MTVGGRYNRILRDPFWFHLILKSSSSAIKQPRTKFELRSKQQWAKNTDVENGCHEAKPGSNKQRSALVTQKNTWNTLTMQS